MKVVVRESPPMTGNVFKDLERGIGSSKEPMRFFVKRQRILHWRSSTADQMMVTFIDTYREKHGVGPICETLPIAPSVYYEQKAREEHPEHRPLRHQPDDELRPHIMRVWEESFGGVYGARKIWEQLNREGLYVAHCTVERSCVLWVSKA